MLQSMRDNAQGLVSKIIIGAIIAVMSMFGFGGFLAFTNSDPVVAEVNGDGISQQSVEVAVQQQRRSILARMGADADPSLIDEVSLRQSVVDNLINRQLLLQEAEAQNLGVAEGRIAQDIRAMEQFQFDGAFDQQLYLRRLGEAGYSHESFRQALSEDTRLSRLTGGLAGTAFVTKADLERVAAITSQQRDLAWLALPLERFRAELTASDGDVAAWYDSHPDRFRTEEQARIAYVELAQASLEAEVEIKEEDIAAAWESGRDSFIGGERRRSSHILLATDERTDEEALALAEDLRTQLQEGADFAALAEEFSADPGSAKRGGDLGFAGKGTFVPPFETALFALQEVGDLSAPVVTEFGVHLIRLDGVQVDNYPSLADQHDLLAAELRANRAEDLFQNRVARMEELAFEDFGGLDALAETLGLEVKELGPVLKSGSGEGLAAEPAVVRAVFSQDTLDGYNSAPLRVSGDRAVVLRVLDHKPASRRPLAEVAAEVKELVLDERALAAATAAADSAAEELRTGGVAAAVASRLDAEWASAESVDRSGAVSGSQVPQAVVRRAFQLARPAAGEKSVGVAELGDAVAVITVTRVVPGDFANLSDAERTGLQQVLQNRIAQQEILGLQQSLRASADIDR